MNEISAEKLNELFIDTLKRCSSSILQNEDDEIEYDLFEEFDVGVRSFFHGNSLKRLLSEKFINLDILELSKKLRELALNIPEEQWTLQNVKLDKEWMDLFLLSDEIQELKLKYDKNL